MMADENTCDRETATWLSHAFGYGRDLLHAMRDELARGAPLTIDPVAWDNTMAALDWMASEWMARDMRYYEPVTEELRDVLSRVTVLGREALAGEARSPELVALIERCLVAIHGPRWARLPDWPSMLRTRAAPKQIMEEGEPFEWVGEAHLLGAACLHAFVVGVERGDAELRIDRSAWDNTLAAVAWALEQRMLGHVQGPIVITKEDVERVHRLQALGSSALSGGARSGDLVPLASASLVLLVGADWRKELQRIEAYPPADYFPPGEHAAPGPAR
jgi:hypothetical protein